MGVKPVAMVIGIGMQCQQTIQNHQLKQQVVSLEIA